MSEFEIFVMNGLKNMGYEVVPQVGVSGFYIDIGIKHKSFPDGFIAHHSIHHTPITHW